MKISIDEVDVSSGDALIVSVPVKHGKARIVLIGSEFLTRNQFLNDIDHVDWESVTPIGRVHMNDSDFVLGTDRETGALVCSRWYDIDPDDYPHRTELGLKALMDKDRAERAAFYSLPRIILADL